MLYPFQIFFDILFPPTKHELLLRGVSRNRFIHWYRPNIINDTVCLSEYRLPEIQAAITACKFEHNYHAAKLLGGLTQTYLSGLPPKKTILIPIPLSPKRLKKRLFNQVERVLRYSHLGPHYQIVSDLLVRTIDTKPQTSLAKAARLKNINDAFSVQLKNRWRLDNIDRIIICDDVMTTGATLEAAKTALIPHLRQDIELIALTWAH